MTPKSTKHAHDEGSKPDPMISSDLTFQGDATRLTNNGNDSKRRARSIQMYAGSEPTTKRPKNKQDRPARIDTENNPLNNEDRKPSAKNTTPTPDGVPSTCAGVKRKSTSACTGSVVSTRGHGIMREPVIKTETIPAPANPTTDQAEAEAEASIPTETVINGPNLNRTFTVRRKVAKRTDPLYLAPPPQNIVVPLPPSPEAQEIPARKKSRVKVPVPTTRDEAARKTSSPVISAVLPTPVMLPCADDANVSTSSTEASMPSPPATIKALTRRRSSRRVIPTSSTGTNIPAAAAATTTRRRSSRRVIPTSSTGTPILAAAATAAAAATTRRRNCRRVIPPPSTATVDVSTSRRSRRQTQLSPIESSEAKLEYGDDDDL
jgi:hypothetical protein